MNRKIGPWQLLGFATTSIGGTLLHFLYDWTGGLWAVAPFSGVNESTWEHMKLFFLPTFIFALVQGFLFKDRADFWCIKIRGTLLGLILIPVLFYTYNGVIGKSPDWINIAIFFISAAIAYIYEARLFNAESVRCRSQKFAFAALCVIGLLFVIFTFAPPHLAIFKDPITGSFGI